MNAPEPKKPRSEFHDFVLIRSFVQWSPSSVESAWNVLMSLLPGSSRLSSQMAWNAPDGSVLIAGKYWSLGAGRPLASWLIDLPSSHVMPPSCDRLSQMSVPVCDCR